MKPNQFKKDMIKSLRACCWGIIGCLLAVAAWVIATPASAGVPDDGSVLPFPPTPSASVAGQTLQESKMQRRVEKSRLPKDAPNILIILLDDVGFGLPDTFGGPVHTPTLSKLAEEGISYNAFHTTAICSPTRAQSPAGRLRDYSGTGGGLGRIHRSDSADVFNSREGARGLWLQDRCLRQVAQHTRHRDHGDGAVHALADGGGHRL